MEVPLDSASQQLNTYLFATCAPRGVLFGRCSHNNFVQWVSIPMRTFVVVRGFDVCTADKVMRLIEGKTVLSELVSQIQRTAFLEFSWNERAVVVIWRAEVLTHIFYGERFKFI